MIALDTNVLVAFHRAEYAHHEAAVAVLRDLAESPAPWAIPWPCVHEFLAVVTNPRIFKRPSPPATALAVMQAFMESPSLRLLAETPDYWPLLTALVEKGDIVGARIHDARIAALCLHAAVKELWTLDRDFSRFPALRCRNPLIR